ncbi:hypothetical protein C4579_00340 [Candidatus Microgenomates bacterium]|nr:MAG: hypothetical protein C4579_00340 [Candidatus Microgenomates bacterium]
MIREVQPPVTSYRAEYPLSNGPMRREIARSGSAWIEVPTYYNLVIAFDARTQAGSVWVEEVQPALASATAPMGRFSRKEYQSPLPGSISPEGKSAQYEATGYHALKVLKALEGNQTELVQARRVLDPFLAERRELYPDEAQAIDAFYASQPAV